MIVFEGTESPFFWEFQPKSAPCFFLLSFCQWVFFFVTFAPRNPPDRADGRQVLVAGQHQPDGLLPGELRPPELEAAHPAAPQQPPGTSLGSPIHPSVRSLGSVLGAAWCWTSCLRFSQIISVGNRAGLIDDAFNLARWAFFSAFCLTFGWKFGSTKLQIKAFTF